MVPRTEVVGLYEDEPFETHIKVIAQEKYTRYPVFGEDKDEIIGMVNVKIYLFVIWMVIGMKSAQLCHIQGQLLKC